MREAGVGCGAYLKSTRDISKVQELDCTPHVDLRVRKEGEGRVKNGSLARGHSECVKRAHC
eukprot:scaffold13376_cov120-Isochrysis_galbana.AAC.1